MTKKGTLHNGEKGALRNNGEKKTTPRPLILPGTADGIKVFLSLRRMKAVIK